MMHKKRILIYIGGYDSWGGIEAFLLNLSKNLTLQNLQVDILAANAAGLKGREEAFKQYNVTIYDLCVHGNLVARKLQVYPKLKRFLKERNYSVIHINTANMFSELPVFFAAKKCGIPTRVAHSHNTSMNTDHFLKRILLKFKFAGNMGKYIVSTLATHYFACSQLAAEWLFPERILQEGRVKVLNNGIDAFSFRFDPVVRERYRNEMGVAGKLVIGNASRFDFQKNHDFLVDVFAEIHKRQPESILLLVGEGDLQADIQEKVNNLALTDCVRFLGLRADVPQLLQAMDVFVLPSRFEGLPVVAIEVQAAGLKMFMSDAITQEAAITNNLVEFIPLEQGAQVWAEKILQHQDSCGHKDTYGEIVAAGYDMKDTARWLERFYEEYGSGNGGNT